MSTKIPPLLESYLSLPSEASLILLTSVLGASTNWLVLRFLYSALKPRDGVPNEWDGGEAGDVNVCLVSFMRDAAFWKEGARKLGLDLEKLASRKKFVFLDGLTGLYLPKEQRERKVSERILENPALSSVAEDIRNAIKSLQDGREQPRTILIIDQLDLLLATEGDMIDSVGMEEMLLGLRQGVHGTILTLSADAPLVFETQTSLEINHAAFLLSMSHQADLVVSLRLLDSGTAKDVSGVIRVTPRYQETGLEQVMREEGEMLYFVGGDGGVKVFERGQ